MESPPHKRNAVRDEDRISALTDDLLLGILERLDLREAVRAGAVSKRWRHLPHRLSCLYLNVCQFQRANKLGRMEAFTGVASSLLAERECDCNSSRAIKSLTLCFFVSTATHLSSIGRAVEDVVSRGETECLCFAIAALHKRNTESGQQFMSFSRDYRAAFRWLTKLTLKYLEFGHSDVTDLISACDRLKHLSLTSCKLVGEHSTLKIDAPCSRIQRLDFMDFHWERIELISVPNLMIFRCFPLRCENPPVRFGYVPLLCQVELGYRAKAWQGQFMLSNCLSRGVTNLSKLNLNFFCQTIWIQPEDPKKLTRIFRNLTDVGLFGIFPECNLSWTLFILEAAPTLQNFRLSRTLHSCGKKPDDSAEKTNVVWEPSKDLKHLNLKFLRMSGFEEEDKVTSYIKLVMERAVGLKRIKLRGAECKKCDDIDPTRSQVDEAGRRRIKETHTWILLIRGDNNVMTLAAAVCGTPSNNLIFR